MPLLDDPAGKAEGDGEAGSKGAFYVIKPGEHFEAALTGNRKTMAEALILDGSVSDYATAVKLTDALLKAQAEHLPQFA